MVKSARRLPPVRIGQHLLTYRLATAVGLEVVHQRLQLI